MLKLILGESLVQYGRFMILELRSLSNQSQIS
ncbi:MAG: hypothetical protein EZS28_051467, partial [Streblomastix strix]